jgi:hypothetical protein
MSVGATYDLTKPVANSKGASAEMRTNFTALALGLGGRNVIPNGEGLIWPFGVSGASHRPAHWQIGGTAPTTIARETTIKKRDAQSTKIVAAAGGAGGLYYDAFNTTDFNTGFRDCYVHMGEWVYGADSRIYIYDGNTYTYSSYGSAGAWAWRTVSKLLDASAADRLRFGREVAANGTGYFWGATGWLFAGPPQDFFPCPTRSGFLYFPFSGAAAITAHGYSNAEFKRPAIVLGSAAICQTAPVSTAFKWNVAKLTTGPATYTDLYTTDLEIVAADTRGDDSVYEPTIATYDGRCFQGYKGASGSKQANTIISVEITAAGGTAAQYPNIHIEALQFDDPLASWKRSGAFE